MKLSLLMFLCLFSFSSFADYNCTLEINESKIEMIKESLDGLLCNRAEYKDWMIGTCLAPDMEVDMGIYSGKKKVESMMTGAKFNPEKGFRYVVELSGEVVEVNCTK